MSPNTAFILIASLVLLVSLQGVQPTKKEGDDLQRSSWRLDYGWFSTETKVIEKSIKNKMKLSKTMSDTTISSELPFVGGQKTFRWTKSEELVPCANLSIKSKEHEKLVECLTLETQLTGEGKPTPGAWPAKDLTPEGTNSFARKIIFDLKHKEKDDKKDIFQAILYPLKQTKVHEAFEDMVKKSWSGGLKFWTPELLGYYIEFKFKASLEPVFCKGDLYYMVNQSEYFDPSQKPYDTVTMMQLDHLIESAENGFLFGLKDVTCNLDGALGLFLPQKLHLDFFYVKKQEYPYHSLHHVVSIDDDIMNYYAKVVQLEGSESHPDKYKTSINIKMECPAKPELNFHLDQSFDNENLYKGVESMKLMWQNLAVFVDGEWTIDSLLKKLRVMKTTYNPQLRAMMAEKDSLRIDYKNVPGEDLVTLALGIDRDALELTKSYIGNLATFVRDPKYTASIQLPKQIPEQTPKPISAHDEL